MLNFVLENWYFFLPIVVLALVAVVAARNSRDYDDYRYMPRTSRTNVNLELSDDAYAKLIQLQNEYGARDLSEFVSRAVLTIASARERMKAGKKIVLTYQNGVDRFEEN